MRFELSILFRRESRNQAVQFWMNRDGHRCVSSILWTRASLYGACLALSRTRCALCSVVFLLLALRTQQIPQSLPLTRPLASPARRRIARERDAPFGRQHRQERGCVGANRLAQPVG